MHKKEVGIPADLFHSLEDFVRGVMAQRGFSAFSLVLGRVGHGAFCTESRLWGGGSDPLDPIFDVASLTKALVVTPLMFQEIYRGAMSLDAPLGDLWPGAPYGSALLQLSLGDVLGHRSGLPAWRSVWMRVGLEVPVDPVQVHAALKEIFREASISLGGTRRPGFQYSDLGFILLGKVLEGKYGLPLDVLFLEFQRELGLPPAHRLYYAPQLRPEDVQLCVVETTYCPLRQRWLRGEVHDENCAAMGGVSGHAGLFGSGRGIYEFLAALWAHPVGDLLKRAQVQGITQVPLLGPGLYGWRLGNNDSASPFGDGKSIGHQGFTGVDLWVEPQTGRLMVSLTNRIMAGRVSPWMTQFRQEICRRAWAYHGEIYA